MKKILRKTLKILGWTLAIILFLLVLVYILIQVPAVQNFAKNKVVAYIEDKIKTKVSIDRLTIAFPKQIVLKGVYFEDQQKDTLLYGKEMRVDIALFKLLSHEVSIDYLGLDGIKTNVYRLGKDSVFNFDYIVKAFAGEQNKEPQPEDTISTMKFHLNRIVLKDILTTFKDDNSGNDVYFYLGNFETKIKTFDPGKSIFDVSFIRLKNIDARVRRYEPSVIQPVDTTAAATETPSVKLEELSLNNIRFKYTDDMSATLADINIGEFITHPELILLQTSVVKLNDVTLKNTSANIAFNKTVKLPDTLKTKPAPTPSTPWELDIAKINFDNNDIRYDDNIQSRTKKGMDYNHLHLQNLQVFADGLKANAGGYKANITQLGFKEQSGFNLQKFKTNFSYNDSSAILENLLVKTDQTLLRDKIILKYPSLKELSEKPGDIYVDAGMNHCSIAIKDILLFAPQLAGNLKGKEQSVVQLNAGVKGFVKNISIPFFQLNGLGNTVVNLSGNIKGLPDAKNAAYDINIVQLNTTASDIYDLVPAGSIPSNIRIPQTLAAKGNFKGTVKQFQTLLQLHSSCGNAVIKAGMGKGDSYTANVSLDKLNVGYLVKQEKNIGIVTLTAHAKGKGFDLKNAVATLDANIQAAELNGYNYQDLNLQGNIADGIADIKAVMNDENVKFDLTANADIKQKYPQNLKLQLLLDTLNLNALHLMQDTLSLHGNIMADMPQTNPDSLIGKINITELSVYTQGRKLNTDSILLVTGANGTQRNLNVQAEFLRADLSGEYKLTEMAQALQQTINKYYHLADYQEKNIAPQNWQMQAAFNPSPLILQFVPGLKGSDSILLHASFNSTANNLDVSLRSRKIIYDQSEADSLNIIAKTNNDKLDFSASVQNAKSGSVNLYHTALYGFIANNKADLALDVSDKKNKVQYNIAGTAEQINEAVKFSLKPDGLLLDYDKWTVAADNYIQYDSTGIIVNNFKISNGSQSFTINSTSKTANAPIEAIFNNFQIGTITKIAHQDLLMEGTINGNAVIKDVTKSPVFTSDLQVNNLVYKKDTIGNISIKVNNEQANAYAADISLQGNQTDVRLTGLYYTGESRMDLKLNVNSLNLAAVKPFALTQLQDIGGFAKGNLTIAGTASKPLINGNINFDNAFVIPTATGAKLTLSNDAINFAPDGIHLNNFTLLDSAGHKAIVSGDILTNDFREFKFNAALDADNFMVVNTAPQTNKLFYGKLNIDAHIKIKGDMGSPVADGSLRINKSTDFTMILPNSDPELQEREGIVLFVDKDHPDTITAKTIYDSLSQSEVKGLDVNVNIITDSAAKLTLVIDERNGDALTMQGTANLAAGMDKSGKINLTGTYQLTHGSYQVSLSILKRKFEIQPGSLITWTGEPTLAEVDITAIYEAKTAPIDLVIQQLAGMSQEDITRYKQKLPFQVKLSMKGELLKPVITFDITLPPDELSQWPEVATKLRQIRTDESELNKQVFAVLLLNRFVQENPFQSSAGGTGIADIGRQSASRILSDQLNQLAGSLIKGVDINFDINSEKDYSTGVEENRTDLNVTVSKKLLNDRLVLNVGSDIALEGSQAAAQNSSVIGNVSADYKLSRDGRYRLRAYRKNDYDAIVEGQVVESGLSFILTFDYNYFRELFESKKQARKAVRESKKQKPKSATSN